MAKLKKTLLIAVLLLLVGGAVFAIAGRGTSNDGDKTFLYFPSKDGFVILPEERSIEAKYTEEFCDEALAELLKGPYEKSLGAIADKSVKVNGFNWDGGKVTVDFSEEYKDVGLLSVYAVIKTLCQHPGVEAVCVTCEGEDVSNGFISGDEINLASDDDCATGIELYFANEKKTKLVSEYRRVNITDKQPVEQYIVTELIKGPTLDKHVRLLSQDTGILSVETTDGTCYVNFKKDFVGKNTAQDKTGRLTVYSIVNSLTERENVNNVQFLIEGKKVENFGEIKFDELFSRNENLIEK